MEFSFGRIEYRLRTAGSSAVMAAATALAEEAAGTDG
jgi:hypothetical protein